MLRSEPVVVAAVALLVISTIATGGGLATTPPTTDTSEAVDAAAVSGTTGSPVIVGAIEANGVIELAFDEPVTFETNDEGRPPSDLDGADALTVYVEGEPVAYDTPTADPVSAAGSFDIALAAGDVEPTDEVVVDGRVEDADGNVLNLDNESVTVTGAILDMSTGSTYDSRATLNTFKGTPVALDFGSENTEFEINTSDGFIFAGSTGPNSQLFVFDTTNRDIELPYTFLADYDGDGLPEADEVAGSVQLRRLGLTAEPVEPSVMQGGTLEVDLEANTGGRDVEVTVRDSNGNLTTKRILVLDGSGEATYTLDLAADAPTGDYSVTVTDVKSGVTADTKTVSVRELAGTFDLRPVSFVDDGDTHVELGFSRPVDGSTADPSDFVVYDTDGERVPVAGFSESNPTFGRLVLGLDATTPSTRIASVFVKPDALEDSVGTALVSGNYSVTTTTTTVEEGAATSTASPAYAYLGERVAVRSDEVNEAIEVTAGSDFVFSGRTGRGSQLYVFDTSGRAPSSTYRFDFGGETTASQYLGLRPLDVDVSFATRTVTGGANVSGSIAANVGARDVTLRFQAENRTSATDLRLDGGGTAAFSVAGLEGGVYDVTVTDVETGVMVDAGTVSVGGTRTRPTIELADPAPVTPSGVRTVELVARNASDPVGAYEVTVTVENTSVATIESATVANAPDGVDVTVAADNGSVTIAAYGLDTGTGSIGLGTVDLRGQTPGRTGLRLSVDQVARSDGSVYTMSPRNTTVRTITVSPVVGDDPPNDLDGDGSFEDVNGDGTANIVDVQAVFANRDDTLVRTQPEYFDFNGDGRVDVADVQRIYVELVG